MIRAYAAALLCCALSLLPCDGFAGIYKYRDAAGQLVFVDDESKIPPAYRDNVTELSGADEPAEEATLTEEPPRDTTADGNVPTVEEAPAPLRSPVVIEKNRVMVPVTVTLGNRSEKLTLLLDTGATATVLYRHALARLELPSGKLHKARVAGGGTVKAERIRFHSFGIGPYLLNRPYAMVLDHEGREAPYDGLLGMDFLKGHPYQIDFEQQEIVWGALE